MGSARFAFGGNAVRREGEGGCGRGCGRGRLGGEGWRRASVGGACVCLEGREKKTAWCRVWEMEGLRGVAGGAEI